MNNGKKQMNIIIVLLAINLIATAFVIIKPSRVSSSDIISAIEQVEAMKVGGQKNFKLLKEVSQSAGFQKQTREQFEMMLMEYNEDFSIPEEK